MTRTRRRRTNTQVEAIAQRHQKTESEAGLMEEGSAGSLKEEGSAGLLKEEGVQKTKIVRLGAGACCPLPMPRIPTWKLAMESEYSQDLYRRSIAMFEKMDKLHE
jgi:hypothetical protein